MHPCVAGMAAVWWLAWAYLVPLARAFCPRGCSCDDSLPSARCVGAGLNLVPILFNPSLRRLDLAHNSIASLEEALVFLSLLEDLDLSHNQLESLGVGNFQAQSNLKKLSVAHNNLSALLPRAFTGLAALTRLDLSYNSLDDLPEGVLDDLPHLTVLHLSHNRLFFLSQLAFRGPKSLLLLDLSDNYFRHVPTEALQAAASLQTLHLCRNRLTELGPSAFSNHALKLLALDGNSIERLDQATFMSLKRLQNLSLVGNSIHEVPTNALSFLPKLEFLSLSRNKIREVRAGAFSAQGLLMTLEMSRNPELKVMSPEALSGCGQLQHLTLSHNPQLRHLPSGLFKPLKNLRSLDLRDNGLESLPEVEVPWKTLQRLDLRDNPLVCNCSVRWLAQLVRSANTSIASRDLQCAAPDKLRGLYLSRLTPREQLCGEGVETVLAVVAGSGILRPAPHPHAAPLQVRQLLGCMMGGQRAVREGIIAFKERTRMKPGQGRKPKNAGLKHHK
ncbi:chondroadherin-like protein isoform X1 [Scylla paramamosain]|uniref:chondroadherin-like protein isoform X1 n=2 Tax=Scylla paramamosain TaxID=85552 RepID=UPI003082C315